MNFMAVACFEKHCYQSFFFYVQRQAPGWQEIQPSNASYPRRAEGLSPRCVQVVLAAYIASRYDRSLAVDIVKALLQKRSIQIESGE